MKENFDRSYFKINITSEAGKTKVIKALKVKEGIVDIEMDIKT